MPYPPPPGPRIAYDINGTIGLVRDYSGVVRDVNPDALRYMNGERSHAAYVSDTHWSDEVARDQWLSLIFPVPTRLYAAFVLAWDYGFGGTSLVHSDFWDLSTAPNTTNGEDGTWTKLGNMGTHPSAQVDSDFSIKNLIDGTATAVKARAIVNDIYRRPYEEGGYMTLSGPATRHVRGIKLKANQGFSYDRDQWIFVIHLYGEPDTDSSDNILLFYDPDEELTAPGDLLDWGDVPMGSSAVKSFRLFNNSAAQTARSIVINAQMGITTTTPVPSDSFLFSLNGTTWNSSVTLTALSPGTASGQIRVKRNTPLNAQPSNWAPRVVATVGSWS
jgi:hypothetical protein